MNSTRLKTLLSGIIYCLSISVFLNIQQALAQGNIPVYDPAYWETDGSLNSMSYSGNTLYLAGSFTYAGPLTGSVAMISGQTGNYMPGFPKVNGVIYTIIGDGSGGWFIGGQFDTIDMQPIHNLAHIKPDFSLDATFRPEPGNLTDFRQMYVKGLTRQNNTLYVCGNFEFIAGQRQSRLAAINTAGGSLAASFHPSITGNSVSKAVISGSLVYICGVFGSVNGQARTNLAALQLSDGSPAPFSAVINDYVNDIAIYNNTLYAGGWFNTVNGAARKAFAAFDLGTGQLSPADAQLGSSSIVSRVFAYADNRVLLSGLLNGAGSASVINNVIVDANGSFVSSQLSTQTGYVLSLAPFNGKLLLTGSFTEFGGRKMMRTALWNPNSGELSPFAAASVDISGPTYSASVYASSAGPNGNLVLGGSFTSAGGYPRIGLAAIDTRTGEASGWNPVSLNSTYSSFHGIVKALTNGDVFVNDVSDSLNGYPAPAISILEGGSSRPRNLDVNSYITPGSGFNLYAEPLEYGQSLILGGSFSINTPQGSRGYLMQIDKNTGIVSTWNPNPNGYINSACIADGKLYVGGVFTSIAGQARTNLAAFDLASMALLPWNPQITGEVKSISAGGGRVYVAGNITMGGGMARKGFAAFNASSGDIDPWDPQAAMYNFQLQPEAVAYNGDAVYLGGTFKVQSDNSLVAVDAITGTRLNWTKRMYSHVLRITLGANKIYASCAGSGHWLPGNLLRNGYSAFSAPTLLNTKPALLSESAGAEPYPNPAQEEVHFGFSEPVNVQVINSAGKAVQNERLLPGHAINTRGLQPGIYLLRIELHNGAQISRKLVKE
ncbi:MAG: T9SS type A sorting domain-containing protein [Bacteroidota bacterium]